MTVSISSPTGQNLTGRDILAKFVKNEENKQKMRTEHKVMKLLEHQDWKTPFNYDFNAHKKVDSPSEDSKEIRRGSKTEVIKDLVTHKVQSFVAKFFSEKNEQEKVQEFFNKEINKEKPDEAVNSLLKNLTEEYFDSTDELKLRNINNGIKENIKKWNEIDLSNLERRLFDLRDDWFLLPDRKVVSEELSNLTAGHQTEFKPIDTVPRVLEAVDKRFTYLKGKTISSTAKKFLNCLKEVFTGIKSKFESDEKSVRLSDIHSQVFVAIVPENVFDYYEDSDIIAFIKIIQKKVEDAKNKKEELFDKLTQFEEQLKANIKQTRAIASDIEKQLANAQSLGNKTHEDPDFQKESNWEDLNKKCSKIIEEKKEKLESLKENLREIALLKKKVKPEKMPQSGTAPSVPNFQPKLDDKKGAQETQESDLFGLFSSKTFEEQPTSLQKEESTEAVDKNPNENMTYEDVKKLEKKIGNRKKRNFFFRFCSGIGRAVSSFFRGIVNAFRRLIGRTAGHSAN